MISGAERNKVQEHCKEFYIYGYSWQNYVHTSSRAMAQLRAQNSLKFRGSCSMLCGRTTHACNSAISYDSIVIDEFGRLRLIRSFPPVHEPIRALVAWSVGGSLGRSVVGGSVGLLIWLVGWVKFPVCPVLDQSNTKGIPAQDALTHKTSIRQVG